uniref:FBA_1 domain-containing protein n=1 Tax=Steinernema glaseri TaxID=37863 RepID=A0A1I7ZF34_9BILA
MDAVPLKFVDSVVELFDGRSTLDLLEQEVAHPLWKSAVDVHHRNRVCCELYVQVTDGGIKLVFENGRDHGDLESIQKNRRFARITAIMAQYQHNNWPSWEDVPLMGEAEAIKKLKSVASQFEPRSCFMSTNPPPDGQAIMISSLLNKASFKSISTSYHGQVSLDFLASQVYNSPWLTSVCLEYDWPKSVLPIVETFCLKGRPGRIVNMSMLWYTSLLFDSRFLETLFDYWRAKGNLHLFFWFSGIAVKNEGHPTLSPLFNQGQIEVDNSGKVISVFKHGTEKSIFCFDIRPSLCYLKFYTCECDISEDCRLKSCHPQHHNY